MTARAGPGTAVAPEVVPVALTGLARARATVGAYVALTKPRIIELLLVTTVPTMVLAARGWPGWLLVVRRSSVAPSPRAAPTP